MVSWIRHELLTRANSVLFPTPHLATSLWLFEIHHGESIYTLEIGESFKSGLLNLFREPVYTSIPLVLIHNKILEPNSMEHGPGHYI